MRTKWGIVLFLGAFMSAASWGQETVKDLIKQAGLAQNRGDTEKALTLYAKAVAQEPKNPDPHYHRGLLFDKLEKHAEAHKDFSRVIELDAKWAGTYHLRGMVHFKLGKIKESVADFDKFLDLEPKRLPSHWQRGISFYYTGQFAQGQKQFEGYQTFDDNDVENAVWRFLCQARKDGVEMARKDMLKIGPDDRVPMREVYDLFMGKIKPEEVLAAAKDKKTVRDQLPPFFYAHLYLGLYYEVLKEKKLALEHMNRATEEFRNSHYMWHVARVHRDLLKKDQEKK